MQFFIRTYQVYHTYVRAEIQPHLLLIVRCSFWHGVEYGVAFSYCRVPLLSLPWPIQNRPLNAQSFERLSGNTGPNVTPKRLAS